MSLSEPHALNILPGSARDFLRDLIEERDGLHAALLAVTERAAGVRVELADERFRLGALQRERIRDRKAEALLEQNIAASISERARLQETIGERQAAWDASARVVQSLVEQLQSVEAHQIVEVELTSPKLHKNERPEDALQRLRGDLGSLAADRARTASTPLPAAVAKAVLREDIEVWAAGGQPDLGGILAGTSRTIGWPELPFVYGVPHTPGVDVRAVLAWLAKDAIIERLEAAVDEALDGVSTLTHEERVSALAKIDARRLQVERDEEALIRRLESDGRSVTRRADADARAVFSIDIDLTREAPPAPESDHPRSFPMSGLGSGISYGGEATGAAI